MGQLHKSWSEQKSQCKEALEGLTFKADLGKSLDRLEKIADELGNIRKKVETMLPQITAAVGDVKGVIEDYKDRIEAALQASNNADVKKQLNALSHKLGMLGIAAQNGYGPACLKIQGAVNSIRERLSSL